MCYRFTNITNNPKKWQFYHDWTENKSKLITTSARYWLKNTRIHFFLCNIQPVLSRYVCACYFFFFSSQSWNTFYFATQIHLHETRQNSHTCWYSQQLFCLREFSQLCNQELWNFDKYFEPWLKFKVNVIFITPCLLSNGVKINFRNELTLYLYNSSVDDSKAFTDL